MAAPPHGHDLVDHCIGYHRPDEATVAVIEDLRQRCADLGHHIVEVTPACPDQTLAIRALHDACQRSLFALVANQETSTDA